MRAAPVLVGLLIAGCQDRGEAAAGAQGDQAAIPVVDVDGITAALVARRGQPLLVNLWARWCPHCVAELPDLVAVGRDIRRNGGEVLGFSMDLWGPGYDLGGARRDLPGFLAAHGVDYPVFLYGSSDPSPVLQRFGLDGDLPVTLAIDREGNVVGAVSRSRATRAELAELARRACGG